MHDTWKSTGVQLFHYHLVTSEVRDVEARYVGKLGFELVARYGRIGEEHVAMEAGVSWEKLDRDGFKLRLSELERGAVNVVVQPGHWRVPRLDHLGIALDEEEFQAVLGRAAEWGLRVQEHGARRTFVATNAGYRLEVHPPREWVEELLSNAAELALAELQLRADQPELKANALADILGLELDGDAVVVGDATVRFLPGGPEGRPELHAERFA
jgi:catechol 2,3-dioxygenase-like lactoylglutathione lyase family enzyme